MEDNKEGQSKGGSNDLINEEDKKLIFQFRKKHMQN